MNWENGQLVFVAFEVPLVAVTSGTLLFRFCARHGAVPFLVALLVGLVWFMCLLLPFLLPLDVAETVVQRCHVLGGNDCGSSLADPKFIGKVWRATFWFSFTMSWVWLPLVASYLLAGAFSTQKRILFALRDRLIFFGVVLGLFGLLVLVSTLQFGFSLRRLSGVVISLANIFGIFVAILMLSYGLIEVPKWLWKAGGYESALRNCEYRATHTMERMQEASVLMGRALGDINSVMALYEKSKNEMPLQKRQTIKKYIRLIRAEVPVQDLTLTMPRAIVDETAHFALTEEFLARIRFKVKKAVIEFRKVNYLWRKRCAEAFDLQDLLQWRRGELTTGNLGSKIQFGFRLYIVPIFSRIAAIGASFLTIAVIWSEATLWTITLPQSLDLSPFSFFLHRMSPPSIVLQVGCFLCVSYLFFCMFFGIFRFRLFMLYELIPKHTDSFTLVLNSMLCSRLLIPLAYNFITLMHETSFSVAILYADAKKHVPIPQIASVHRGLDEVPIFGVSFNLYFPAIIVLFVILTLCRVWDRIMSLFDLSTYSFEGVGDERLEEYGRSLLAQERAKWMEAKKSRTGPHPRGYVDANVQNGDQAVTRVEEGRASAAVAGSSRQEQSSRRSTGRRESGQAEEDSDETDEVCQQYEDQRKPSALEEFGKPAPELLEDAQPTNTRQPGRTRKERRKRKKKADVDETDEPELRF